jgi:hypothetical protein
MRPITISLLILMFFLFSCGSKNSNPDNYFNKYELTGNVKEVIQESYYSGDNFGEPVKIKFKGREDYSFDINHNILSYTSYSLYNDDLTPNFHIGFKLTYIYDDKNSCIEIRYYNEKGDIFSTSVYNYKNEYVEVEGFSSGGKKSKWTEKIDKNRNIIEDKDKTRFIYDSRNNLIEVIYSENSRRVYEYNDGKLTSEIRIDESKETPWRTIKYNDKGFIDEVISLGDKYTYQYEYDTQGNWVKKLEFLNGHPFLIYERKLKYY